jgi:matrixin
MPSFTLFTRRAFPLLAASLLTVTAAAPLAATSFVMVSDENLADQASVIAEVRVDSVEPAPIRSGAMTDYQVDIERLVKGYTAGSSIVVRVLGGVRPDGLGLKIWGAPVFHEGERALLFLAERKDGSYGILHLMLGAFHEVTVAGRQIAVRELSGASELQPSKGGGLESVRSADPPRDAARFTDWLADRAAGTVRPADYAAQLSAGAMKSLREKFTVFTDPSNGHHLRWFEFDGGGSVTFFADTKGQPGLADGGFGEFQTALAAWTNEPTTPIRYLYGGKTTARGGLKNFDDTNAILFEDPNDEISGVYDCSKGGTLAVGGPWFASDTTARFNGQTYDIIQGADIVINNGLECFFQSSGSPQRAAEELFAHELGHTLGLGHSSESRSESNPVLRDALMFAFIHDDGRGARFGSDDLAGIRSLYAPNVPTSGGRCRANAQTLCLLNGRFSVQLAWENQFDGSSGVGRAIPATDVTGYFSFGDPSNIELLIKVLDFGSAIKVFYGELTNLHFTLTVTDGQTGTVKTYGNTAGDCGGIDQSFLGSATAASTATGKQASAVLGARGNASGSCRSDATTLCLLSGRFAVRVNWQNPGNGTSGQGGANALSNLVGTFFFTDRSNVELMTKVVPFPDRVVFFYGALSDLPYSIQVTDTVNGAVRNYQSTAGKLCGGLDNSAFAP